ncbi:MULTISPECIES: Cro/CI family transcriptional regulator [Acinetobacter]|uniref:Cro/CI family transcriptional regulator n=1 Tax=Acinetobacter TaxID=469 RepID=UPI0009099328|nr:MULTISPECIES: Cro/CI family transcriptional regulator [Acinetobacter]APJ18518.1 hypothetical protein BS064_05200 [Acinetobacter baumannii]EKX8116148.1 hypothetical protein [Acinetobacter baumannii]MDI6494124.1 Cro/CI family transcriptional regulator [Acinetobacter baumannii]NAR68008.1 hypothetical protein [Acinetobacter haemolyticus]HCT8642634.1 hypothetical protein [Acinetobacter baumannii]
MTVDDLRTHFKAESDAALARKLGKDRSVISYWRKGIPPRTQATFEVLTKGKLKADRQALAAS